MTLTIDIPKDKEAGIREASTRRDMERLRELLGDLAAPAALALFNGDPLQSALDRLRNRTPDEIRRDRDEALAAVTPPLHMLPEGKTLAETLAGSWPGDESDEDVALALKKLS